MADNGNVAPETGKLNRFAEIEQGIEIARAAAVGAFALYEAMIADSNAIADEVLRHPLRDHSRSPIRDYWPLTRLDTMQPQPLARKQRAFIISDVSAGPVSEEVELQPDATLFWTDYFDADLAALYRTNEVPLLRAFLINDLDKWAGEMARKGWSIVFSTELDRPKYTGVWINKDTPEIRQHLGENAAKGLQKIDEDVKIEQGMVKFAIHKVKGGLTGKGRTSVRSEYGFVDFADRPTKKIIEEMLAKREA